MRIQTVVQHAGFVRAHLLPSLLAKLPKDAQVVTDPGEHLAQRSPWRAYQACLRTLEPDASHLCVVQDDCLPCRDFAKGLELVVAARPDDVVCLFVSGAGRNSQLVLEACYRNERWALLEPWPVTPLVATVWPRDLAGRFLAFVEAKDVPLERFADDGLSAEFARDERIPVWATVPSLVEHEDKVESLVGTAHFGGAASHRCASCWLGGEVSPTALDWQ